MNEFFDTIEAVEDCLILIMGYRLEGLLIKLLLEHRYKRLKNIVVLEKARLFSKEILEGTKVVLSKELHETELQIHDTLPLAVCFVDVLFGELVGQEDSVQFKDNWWSLEEIVLKVVENIIVSLELDLLV